jgi:hypothetical protein
MSISTSVGSTPLDQIGKPTPIPSPEELPSVQIDKQVKVLRRIGEFLSVAAKEMNKFINVVNK